MAPVGRCRRRPSRVNCGISGIGDEPGVAVEAKECAWERGSYKKHPHGPCSVARATVVGSVLGDAPDWRSWRNSFRPWW